MPGLPIVDELYFEHPSVRLGGWLAFHLDRSELPYMNLTPGESDVVGIPVNKAASLQEVVTGLEQKHKTRPAGTYYYRGQVGRRQLQCPCEIPRLGRSFPHLARPTFKIESFLPSAYRKHINLRPDGTTPIIRWPAWKPESPLAGVGPVARALMQSRDDHLRAFVCQYFLDAANHPEIIGARLLATRGAASNSPPADLVSPGTNVLKSLLTLISWAQHYEFGSIMVDISSSPVVAAWFASHRWSGEVANDPDGFGVIYRFDYHEIRRFLDKELDRETPAAPLIRALGFLGLTDISHLPPTTGKRPSAQCGGSFLGLQNVVLGYLMSIYPGLEIFTFPLQSVTGRETRYSKEDLCPADDVALGIFPPAGDPHPPLTGDEIGNFLESEGFDGDQRGFLIRAFHEGLV